MKDKRQRMAIAWPYAAVYTDPAFAASLLQAAASSLPLHYPPPPPVYSPHYPRYHPYPSFGIPQSSSLPISAPGHMSGVPQNISQTLPTTHGFNLNMGLDFPSPYQSFDLKTKPISPGSSPVNSDLSLSPVADVSATQLTSSNKPKLFKPYKEA